MRMISFALTTEHVRAKTKTVTRRLGWKDLKPGTLLQPVVKGQGIPKGGCVEKIGGPIRVVSAWREPLSAITTSDVEAEGFPGKSRDWFIELFCAANGCDRDADVTRIEFEYVCAEETLAAGEGSVPGQPR